jgi:CRP/FNR family cyclic AMP-dependent transcriptional regulator
MFAATVGDFVSVKAPKINRAQSSSISSGKGFNQNQLRTTKLNRVQRAIESGSGTSECPQLNPLASFAVMVRQHCTEQAMADNVETALRKTPLFANLTEQEMHALSTRVSKMHFRRGELLFGEGDSCTGLFLVTAGKIRIFKLSTAGREQVLAVEGPGSSFAELPVFDGGKYPASASALENAEVLFISRKDFQNFCREHPDVALKLIAIVGARLRRLVGIIEELSFTTVRQRLIALILRLAQASGTPSKEGVRVELTKTHQDLAAELGTVRELVSRNLSRLQAEGFLEVEGRKIIVKDLVGLRREQTSSQ